MNHLGSYFCFPQTPEKRAVTTFSDVSFCIALKKSVSNKNEHQIDNETENVSVSNARSATDTLNIITRCFSVYFPISHLFSYLSLLRARFFLPAFSVYGTEVLKGKYTSLLFVILSSVYALK